MAGSGAQVSAKVQLARASIFEVLAQDNLSTGLRSAFQYLVNVLTEANPEKYLQMKNWFDEIYLLFDIVIQYSHLRAFKASFPEHFYGLRRVDSSGRRMSQEQLLASLALVSLLPYVRKKLDNLLNNLRHEQDSHPLEHQSRGHYFIRIYSLTCFLAELSNLILQISYCLEKSKYYSIWCQVVGVQLVVDAPEETADRSSGASRSSIWLLSKLVAKTIGSCLYAGAFFIQFLEYYYHSRDGSLTADLIPLPKPPPPVTSLYSRVKVNRLKDFCLLCNERRENDTVLSTSGYIFCFSCIRAFVARNKKCPATGIPSSPDHLIRLYPPE